VAVSVDEVRRDGARTTAIIVDSCCLRERESLVRAFDEDFDGCCAGAAAEFFVFAGEFVPVFSRGCGRGEFGGWDRVKLVGMDGWRDLLSWSLNSFDMLLKSASLRTAVL
jgi:hypothetical protein